MLLMRPGLGVIVAMLLGAVVAMSGSLALTGSSVTRKVKTAMSFPVALGVGMAAGVLTSSNTDLMLSVFVVVMFIAVAIRRWGIPYFFSGFMGWMGYFFASFTHATWSRLPFMMLCVLVATAWVLLLAATVLRTRPRRSLTRTVRAFGVRARLVAQTLHDLLAQRDESQRVALRIRLRTRAAQLSEAALMVEGWLVEPQALPEGWSALTVRRWLLDLQQVMDRMASATIVLLGENGAAAELAAEVADALAKRDDQRAAQLIIHFNDIEGPERWAALEFSEATARFLALSAEVRFARQVENAIGEDGDFEPAVELFLENLPGSPALAPTVPARGHTWNPLARMDFPIRQAIQVAVAGGLAILAGRALSPERYYWAVIAAFIMSAGTATRVEAALKGLNRVVGTLAGLVAAVALAEWTAGHAFLVLGVIVLSMFFGFYLFRLSYAYFIFFLTIMLGQLYSILHEFSSGLLFLRLEETAIGAACGLVAALFIVPLSAHDAIRTVRYGFMEDLAAFLDVAAEIPSHPERANQLEHMVRQLENRYRQLVQVADPVTPPLAWGFSRPQVRHRLSMYAALIGYVRMVAVGLRGSSADTLPVGWSAACRALAAQARGAVAGLPSPFSPDLLTLDHPRGERVNPLTRSLTQIQSLLKDFVVSKLL